MPRKAYLNDLAAAAEISSHGSNISNVRSGNDDGEFIFSFSLGSHNAPVDVSVLIPDLSEYPNRHECHIFASEDAPASIAKALEHAPDLSGIPLSALLLQLSRYLTAQTRPGGEHDRVEFDSDGDARMVDSQSFDAIEDDWEEDCENEDWALNELLDVETHFHGTHNAHRSRPLPSETSRHDFAARARSDLRAVKAAGFKVGVLGKLGPDNTPYVSISCRIAKLGISEEAMTAWSITPEQYLILIINYKSGYKPFDILRPMEQFSTRRHLEMRTGISNSYKAFSLNEAHSAFNVSLDGSTAPEGVIEGETTGFRQSFISRPLDELLNGRFMTLLKYRVVHGLTWDESATVYTACQGRDTIDPRTVKHTKNVPETSHSALPDIVIRDELQHCGNPEEISLPLIAMQFLLRHFVCAPSFCLVCHCKLENQLEAIKPYVCDKGLCLYQYMSLGFGPSIEHELIAQPYVVDLLVSFCYASVRAASLHNYPEGLGLMVPAPELHAGPWRPCIQPGNLGRLGGVRYQAVYTVPIPPPAQSMNVSQRDHRLHQAKVNRKHLKLLFDLEKVPACPVRKGDWIAIDFDQTAGWHCRIIDTNFYPRVGLGEPLVLESNQAITTSASAVAQTQIAPADIWQAIQFQVYSQNFDDLSTPRRCESLQLLLDLMPSVTDMRDYLRKKRGASLATWTDRISPATLSLLRWILVSNRSCIMQVDRHETPSGAVESSPGEQRVAGVPEWLQFRFAMGAPDKEQRFIDAIMEIKMGAKFPTLFAWHGSRLANWHNIIRESLNFDATVNGRAYGDGVYMARDFHTSMGYSGQTWNPPNGCKILNKVPDAWPQSILQFSTALALVEVINAPEQFVSHSPYYVVKQLDWIQTRYLFVRPWSKIKTQDVEVGSVLPQDPSRTPVGTMASIVIPMTAIPKSRRNTKTTIKETTSAPKKARLSLNSIKKLVALTAEDPAAVMDDDLASIMTDVEDNEILEEPQSTSSCMFVSNGKKSHLLRTTTPFVPGTLKDLPTMPVPSYATSSATKRLQKDFRILLSTQESHIAAGTLPELGWYMDPEHISRTDNLYQWIIELHSFPKDIPLAKDLTARSIQSVVLEFRFSHTYPMEPPFVRVVRPRFLPIREGGGGHVTMGGSICLELLTNSGWLAASSLESVLLQIRMAITATEPQPPARLENSRKVDYDVGEAVEAYKRACRSHGWTVPPGLDEVAMHGGGGAGIMNYLRPGAQLFVGP